MTSGQKFGVRIQVQEGNITTYVEDSADVSYRKCSSAKIYTHRIPITKYHMILVSRNFMNNKNDTKITDIDINSISISVMDPKSMPSKE